MRSRWLVLIALIAALGLAVRPAAGAEKVTFHYAPPAGKATTSVSLRGSMNNWGEAAMTKQDDGSWAITLDLEPGDYQYKYFINGEWPSNMENGLDGGPIDADAQEFVDDGYGGRNAVRKIEAAAGVAAAPKPALASAPPLEEARARIHYHRPDGRYDGFGLHVWEDSAEPGITWTAPLKSAGEDDYGLFWDVRLKPNAAKLGFIIHKGDVKDPGPDMFLAIPEQGREVWLVTGRNTLYTSAPDVAALAAGDLTKLKAHWVRRDLILWPGRPAADAVFNLHVAPGGGLKPTPGGVTGGESLALTRDPAGPPPDVREQFPYLTGMTALRLSAADAARAPELLKGQLAVSLSGPDGRIKDSTGLQIPGVLDELFYFDGPLGATWSNGAPTLALWAPTARSVNLLLYADPTADAPARHVPMTEQNGVWSVAGDASWKGMYYLYEVSVFVPSTGVVETNQVTDPYSRGLSRNSTRSLLVDLNDPATRPDGWDAMTRPPLAAPEDITLYELHIRDFSALAADVPAERRGTYLAFTQECAGTRHLASLAKAGLTHVHLLPTFDIATINEDRSTWQDPGDLGRFAPDSEEQQAAVGRVRDSDGFNWGYDPWHFGVPEGSYAVHPDGAARLREFRQMVQALNGMGLRVVLDVVYNHTNASGQDPKSVFDRIVPGYYYRLNASGEVETSTCCRNTASEHRMMEKFIVDDLVHWARDYRIDGFRFDLMGHHMRRNLEKARDALRALTVERDGVDGSTIYLYGEGWDFGEVARNARGKNATQLNMAGTGVGTFNDRIRDAIRGGNPFNDRREQGFATGLMDDPNGYNNAGPAERDRLLESTDRLKIGLAGNLTGYRFTGRSGQVVASGNMPNGGYTQDPQETINYYAAHDNETMWDKIAYAAPTTAPVAERVRMQMMAMSLVGLGQGIPFFHSGEELLRSKSMDADSYNSGDWFNRLDFGGATNNFGVGLPMADKNRDRWPTIRPLLARADLRPTPADIKASADWFRDILAIRRSSPLFRLRTADDIQSRVSFPGSGPSATPEVIVMALADDGPGLADLDPAARRIVVIFNATRNDQEFKDDGFKGGAFALHPVQAASSDARVKQARFEPGKGLFRVPARTTAVFVEKQ